MKINGFNPDPLARQKHQVLVSEDGRGWTVIGTTDEPIELLMLHVSTQHAVGFSKSDCKIINPESREIVASFDNYLPPLRDMDAPPTYEWLAVRDRWLDRVMCFLLPIHLYNQRNNPSRQKRIANWFRKHKIEISVHENGAVRVYRAGKVLSEFGV